MTNSIYRPPLLQPEGPKQPVAGWRVAASLAIKFVSAIFGLCALAGLLNLATAIWVLSGMQSEFIAASPAELGAVQGRLLSVGSSVAVLFSYLAWRLWRFGNHIAAPEAALNIVLLRKAAEIFLEFLAVGFSAFAFYNAAISLVGVLGSGFSGSALNHHNIIDFDNWSIFFFWLPSAEMLVSILLIWLVWKLRKFVVRVTPQSNLTNRQQP